MKYTVTLLIPFILFFSCMNSDKISQKNPVTLQPAGDSLEIFAEGIVSTHLNERDMAISPDGTEMFYSLLTCDNSIRVMVHLKKNNNQWSRPGIAAFSGEYSDIEPAFSADGKHLYFASNRPLYPDDNTHDHNIWFVTRSDSGWINPHSMPAAINTEFDEYYPSVSQSGNMYFTARYPDAIGEEDIYMSEFINGLYTQPVRLDTTVNSVHWEFNAYVSPDEKILIFSSYGRSDDLGGGDLYMSNRDKYGNWTASRNLGPAINSQALDYCPFIDWPRKTFYFTSNRSGHIPGKINSMEEIKQFSDQILNGMGNIYRIHISALAIDN